MTIDLLQLDQKLNHDQILLRDRVREFVDSEVLPHVSKHYQDGTLPELWKKELVKLNAIGPTIKGYGAPGLDHNSYGIIMRELERGDSGLRSFASVQGALAMYAIYQFGDESIKERYLPRMAQLELIGCFGLTEPDAGSNPAQMQTTARPVEGGYVLNGTKRWMTNGMGADIAIIWAKDIQTQKVMGFVVDTSSDGVRRTEIKNKWSLRVGPSAQTEFNEVFVPKNHVLLSNSLRAPFSCLNLARFGISWGVLGAQRGCIEEVIHYTQQRSQFNKPLAQHQLIQQKIVNGWIELSKSQLLAFHVGEQLDAGVATPEMISACKMNNVSEALKTSRQMRDCLGANGILFDYHTGRHMLNLETVNSYEGTEDIHRLVLGQALTGLSAFV